MCVCVRAFLLPECASGIKCVTSGVVCVCVCVHVRACVRARARARVCVCVCVCEFVHVGISKLVEMSKCT